MPKLNRIRVTLDFDVDAALFARGRDAVNGEVCIGTPGTSELRPVYCAVEYDRVRETLANVGHAVPGAVAAIDVDGFVTQQERNDAKSLAMAAGLTYGASQDPMFPKSQGNMAPAPEDPTGPDRVVWKFPLNILAHVLPPIEAPGLTRIVHFGRDPGGDLCAWAEIHPNELKVSRRIAVVGTGHAVPAGMVHHGSCSDGPYVWHLYAGTGRVC